MECHMKIQSAIATLVLGAVLVSPVFAQNSQLHLTACTNADLQLLDVQAFQPGS